MTPLRFVLCDVFTDKPLAGQPLAVFTRATGLSDERMQALARELNAPETAFVQPPAAGGHAKVRVFDPKRELREPGHSLLGTAVVLGGALQAEEVRLETPRGPVSVRLEREGARIVFGWIYQPFPVLAGVGASAASVTDALGLERALLQSEAPLRAAEQVVAQASLEQLRSLAPDRRALAQLGVARACVFAGAGGEYQARVFASAPDAGESLAVPATAAVIAAYLMRDEREPAATSCSIELGAEFGRSSLAHVRIDGGPAVHAAPPQASALWVGGAAVVVGRGEVVI
ncbi:MAG TPA: PhzF family phenazine biosynthesis protein [Polyangiaceae bacterium]